MLARQRHQSQHEDTPPLLPHPPRLHLLSHGEHRPRRSGTSRRSGGSGGSRPTHRIPHSAYHHHHHCNAQQQQLEQRGHGRRYDRLARLRLGPETRPRQHPSMEMRSGRRTRTRIWPTGQTGTPSGSVSSRRAGASCGTCAFECISLGKGGSWRGTDKGGWTAGRRGRDEVWVHDDDDDDDDDDDLDGLDWKSGRRACDSSRRLRPLVMGNLGQRTTRSFFLSPSHSSDIVPGGCSLTFRVMIHPNTRRGSQMKLHCLAGPALVSWSRNSGKLPGMADSGV